MRHNATLVLMVAILVFFAHPATGADYYAKGRAATVVLDDDQTPFEMGVLSAGALFGRTESGTGGNGSESIRVWTRTANVTQYLNKRWGCVRAFYCAYDTYAFQIEHRFYTTDARRHLLRLDVNNVAPAAQGTAEMGPHLDTLIDVLNWLPGDPAGSLLKLLYNGTRVGFISHFSWTQRRGRYYDWTVKIGGDLAKVVTDLPSWVPHSEADQWANDQANAGVSSSTGAVFDYHFLTREGQGHNLCLWPQAIINYRVNERIGPRVWPHSYWTGPFGQPHYVNINRDAPAPACP